MKSKAYRAVDVNTIQTAAWLPSRSEFTSVTAGQDIGKEWIYCILRWGNDDFDRPWKVRNPADIDRLVALLAEVAVGRKLTVAMEPTGTYGDALRQALEKAGIAPQRVSPKHASDYAEAMGQVVGVATACVLWDEMGDPQQYSSGAAYRKGMGLNLAERSSGKWEGKLKLSKRGSAKARRWMYLAALRSVKYEPVKGWYARQKAQRQGEGKPALIGIMRKLALALYRVGGRGEKYDRKQLCQSVMQKAPEQAASA
jgi:transposase